MTLVMHHSKELLSAFWGALYLGAIPSIFPFLSEKLDCSLYVQQAPTDSEGTTGNSSSDVLIVRNRLIGWTDGVNGTARCRDNAFAAMTTSPVGCTEVANNN